MTETKLLIGSLSNDLMRISAMVQRGSEKSALRFLIEAKRWADQLAHHNVKTYIGQIIEDVRCTTELTTENAEKLLMYGVRLQNYALHID